MLEGMTFALGAVNETSGADLLKGILPFVIVIVGVLGAVAWLLFSDEGGGNSTVNLGPQESVPKRNQNFLERKATRTLLVLTSMFRRER